MLNPLNPIKRVLKKTPPQVFIYGGGIVTGIIVIRLVQAGMPTKVLTMTAEQAQAIMENPDTAVFFKTTTGMFAVKVASS